MDLSMLCFHFHCSKKRFYFPSWFLFCYWDLCALHHFCCCWHLALIHSGKRRWKVLFIIPISAENFSVFLFMAYLLFHWWGLPLREFYWNVEFFISNFTSVWVFLEWFCFFVKFFFFSVWVILLFHLIVCLTVFINWSIHTLFKILECIYNWYLGRPCLEPLTVGLPASGLGTLPWLFLFVFLCWDLGMWSYNVWCVSLWKCLISPFLSFWSISLLLLWDLAKYGGFGVTSR